MGLWNVTELYTRAFRYDIIKSAVLSWPTWVQRVEEAEEKQACSWGSLNSPYWDKWITICIRSDVFCGGISIILLITDVSYNFVENKLFTALRNSIIIVIKWTCSEKEAFILRVLSWGFRKLFSKNFENHRCLGFLSYVFIQYYISNFYFWKLKFLQTNLKKIP